ncbi:S-layer homology domain-containing protein [Paenibacillus hamazuiensis]|uniref:S-layer homology domain-containing protein n=1 Tax=Paenibacillus hamazuiensis TaxID=2936508 RepID=UPI00200E2681|nr:S-layer homology domain-containing protein [Paenibacillus hamazuiensis]
MIGKKLKAKISLLLVAALTASSVQAGAPGGTVGWRLLQTVPAEAASVIGTVYGSPKAGAGSVTGSTYAPARGLTAAPPAPTGGSWVSPSFDRINLAWEGGNGGFHYRIYRDGMQIAQTDEMAYTDQPLPERSAIDYTVTAVADDGTESAPLHIYAGTPTKGETLLSESETHIPGNDSVMTMAMSGDGQVAAFVSRATNLLPGIGDAENGILYIRNLATGRLTAGYNLQNHSPLTGVRSLSLNRDGSLIAFSAKEADQVEHVFVAEPGSGKLTRITQGTHGGGAPSLTAAGDRVAFITDEALVSEDTNELKDVYVMNVAGGGPPTLIPRPELAFGPITEPRISADGFHVLFAVEPQPRLTFGGFGVQGLFQYDLKQGALTAVDGYYSGYSQSADGRYVAYGKQGSIYLYDRQTSVSSMIVEGSSGGMIYQSPVLDADGNRLVYEFTDYSGTGAGMLNGSGAIWHDLATHTVKRVGHPASYTADESISEDGSRVGYRGEYMGELDPNGHNRTAAFADCPNGCAAAPPQENRLDIVDWQAAGLLHGQIRLSGTILIEAEGSSHAKSVIAHVEYMVYAADSSSLEKRRTDVLLSELAAKAGSYQGVFTVPAGATEITSIQVELTSGQGEPNVRNAARLPLQVAGAESVTLQAPDMSYLAGAKLVAWSPTLRTGATALYSGTPDILLALPSGDDYRLSLIGTDGALMAELFPVVVQSGLTGRQHLQVDVPADLTVEVSDDEGHPIASAVVVLQDPESGRALASSYTDEQGKAKLKTGKVGERRRLQIQITGPYLIPEPETIRLERGLTVKKEVAVKYGTVTGIIKDIDGMAQPGLTVQGISAGKKAIAKTDNSGHYTMRLPEGYAVFSIAREGQGTLYSSMIRQFPYVWYGREVSLDAVVYSVGTGLVQLKLFEERLGKQRQKLDFSSARYSLKVSDGLGNDIGSYVETGNTLRLTGIQDRSLNVCIQERMGQLSACGQVALDDSNSGELELVLREEGAIAGNIQPADPSQTGMITADLSAVDEKGNSIGGSFRFSVSPGAFRLGIAKAGKYELRLTADSAVPGRKNRASVAFRVLSGETLELDPIRLQDDGVFRDSRTNRLEAGAEVSRDGVISLRGTYRNGGSKPAEHAALLVSVPSGTSLVAGSVALNGVPVPADAILTTGAAGYEIAIPGSIAPEESGVLTYKLRAENAAGDVVEPSLRIVYSVQNRQAEELIGVATAALNDVSLHAPETVVKSDFMVDGKAPAGSTVTITDGGEVAGQTQASGDGTWRTRVRLSDRGEDGLHQLRAEASSAGRMRTSQPAWVKLDPLAAQPKELRISSLLHNRNAAMIKADLTDGVAQFQFSIDPLMPLFFSVSFQRPEQIDKVQLHLGGENIPLTYNPLLQQFEGFKLSSQANLGSIWLTYVTKPAPYTANLSEQELLQKLPEGIRSYTGAVTQAETDVPHSLAASSTRQNLAAVTLTSPQTPGEKIEVNYFAEPVADFHPSPLPEGAPPVYDLQYHFNREKKTVTVSAIVPVDQAASMLPATKEAAKLVRALSQDPIAVIRVGADIKYELGKVTPGSGSATDIFGVLKSGYDYKKRMDDMNAMLDQVMGSECLPPHYSQYYADRLNDLSERLIENLVTRYTLQVAGMALAASGVGFLAGAATMAASMAINARLDSLWLDQWNDLQQELQTDQANADCKKKDDRQNNSGDGSSGGQVTGSRRGPGGGAQRPSGKGSHQRVADPTWIYDPSGYVYEAVPSNRIGGVKATAYYLNSDGSWLPWDAASYLQSNPLTTDSEGKYGWDVPEGTWQVLYEKTGYEPASSPVLQVLPPHYDVNVGIVSKQAPEVNALWQERDGSKLQLRFTKYMDPTALGTQTVTVSRAVYGQGEDPSVPVRIEPADAEQDPQGRTWAKTFRIVPLQPFAMNTKYRVRVEPYVQSYAGVPMGGGYDVTIEVTDHLPPFTDIAENVQTAVSSDTIVLMWSEEPNGMRDHYRLQWSREGGASSEGEMTIDAGVGSAVATGLQADQAYRLRLVSVARDGSESAGVTVTAKTLPADKLAADVTPPSIPADASAAIQNGRIHVAWTDPADSDFDRIVLRVKAPGAEAYGSPVYIAKGQKTYDSLPLNVYGTYRIQLMSSDIRDNESAPVTLETNYSGSSPSNNGNDGGSSSGDGGHSGGAKHSGNAPQAAAEVTVSAERSIYEWEEGAVKLQLADQAVPAGTKIKATPSSESGMELTPPANYLLGSPVYALEGDHPLSHPARLSIAYSAASLHGADPRRLGIYKKDPSLPEGWKYIGGAVNSAGSRITAEIGEWGTYAVMLYSREFSDLQGHWSRESLDILVSRHLLDGVDDSHYLPDLPITRAQASRLIMQLLRASGRELPPSGGENPTFRDVRRDDWFAADVAALSAASVIEGDDGSFRPEDPITREELVAMLQRAMRATPAKRTVSLESYSDASAVSEWAVESMKTAIAAGWIQGSTASRLEPRGLSTRAQAGTIMLRILQQAGVIEDLPGGSID